MSKRKARDGCDVCKEKGRNPVGHISKYCAWPGGPYKNNMSGAKAAQREDRKKAKSEKSVQSEQLSQLVCESKALDLQSDVRDISAKVEQLTAIVTMLMQRISKIEDEKKSSVAKGSKGLVSKGSKGKGKGISAPAPRKYYGGWGWDY